MENQENLKEITIKEKLSKKTKILIAVIAIVILIGGSTGIYFFKSMPKMQWPSGKEEAQMEDAKRGVSAEGTTTMGTIAQEIDFDVTITPMYVEEVYVAAGDVVEEDTPLLKITEDSNPSFAPSKMDFVIPGMEFK